MRDTRWQCLSTKERMFSVMILLSKLMSKCPILMLHHQTLQNTHNYIYTNYYVLLSYYFVLLSYNCIISPFPAYLSITFELVSICSSRLLENSSISVAVGVILLASVSNNLHNQYTYMVLTCCILFICRYKTHFVSFQYLLSFVLLADPVGGYFASLPPHF